MLHSINCAFFLRYFITIHYSVAPSRPLVAQLMRCHVVTPKAPVYVTLAPRVVPCPDGPVFLPGWAQPVKLPINSYWVLRFPYIYQGNLTTFHPFKL